MNNIINMEDYCHRQQQATSEQIAISTIVMFLYRNPGVIQDIYQYSASPFNLQYTKQVNLILIVNHKAKNLEAFFGKFYELMEALDDTVNVIFVDKIEKKIAMIL